MNVQVQRGNRELWLSFAAVIAISIAYIFIVTWINAIPGASDFFGHSIGILGFIMMLMTETLYTLRKRSRNARWGRMSTWLDFHIFTGLVGPYMVLLHSSWKFNGLAGIVMLLTTIVVLSGFVGRYIYTAVPRTADGVEIEAATLEGQIAAVNREVQAWMANEKDEASQRLAQSLAAVPTGSTGWVAFFGRAFTEWKFRLQWWYERNRLDGKGRAHTAQLEKMLRRRRLLYAQVDSLAMARRLLALWHAVHIPIGMALFTAAFIHIIAAIYYATLLR